jgi:diacylglycerol kinase family enzyme
MQIGVITNPNSRKNKGRRWRATELQAIVGDAGEVHATDRVDAIKPVLREFLRRKARFLVADGGDGSLHWVVRAGLEVLEEPEFAGATLPMPVPMNGGTIDYVASNVGITGRPEEILTRLRRAVEEDERLEEVEVDSMRIDGVERTADGDVPFRSYGFGSAVGGVGQRFYAKYYADADPNPRTIVKVVSRAIASLAMGPLRALPGVSPELAGYAEEIFRPVACAVTIDGRRLPYDDYTGVHVASMSLDYHGVFKLFPRADAAGKLQVLVGSPSPLGIVRNLPNMHLGRRLSGDRMLDELCTTMTVEATGAEPLDPIIDGEYYRGLRAVTFSLGPRLRIPRIAAAGEAERRVA